MRNRGLVYFFFSCSFITCNSQKQKLPDYIIKNEASVSIQSNVVYDHADVKYQLDSVIYNLESFEQKDKILFNRRDSLILIATSRSAWAYIIDLKNQKIEQRFQLKEVISKNGLIPTNSTCNCPIVYEKDVQSLDFYKNNQIILQNQKGLDIIDTSGRITDSIILNRDNDKSRFLFSNIQEVPISYNPENNTISIFKYCYKCYTRSFGSYSDPLQAKIDIERRKIQDNNIRYPEIYQLFHLGYMETVYRSRFKNLQFFTFSPDHRIYVYDILTDEIKRFDGCSEYSSNKIRIYSKKQHWDSDLVLMDMVNSEAYYSLVYDELRDRYYRMFSKPGEINPKTQLPFYNYYVQIFNNTFTNVSEVKIPRINPKVYFAYDGKLYWITVKQEKVVFYYYTFM